MNMLVGGIALFFGVHMVPILSGVRTKLREALGAGAYKGLFTLGSAVGLVLIVMGYGAARLADNPQIWDPPAGLRHLTMLLMLPVFIFLIAAYFPGRIKARLKHPMLIAVKTWALAHLLVNGDLASCLLFGSFLVWAIVDRISLKRRATSVSAASTIPSVGTASNRNDAIALVGGLAIYGVIVFWGHEFLAGVPII